MTRREQINAQRIGDLHPEFIPIAETQVARWEGAGRHPLIVSGRRTFAAQTALWAQGRTAAGPPCRHRGDSGPRRVGSCALHPLGATVTNARAGESYHNYGISDDAVDLGASGDPDAYESSDWDATDYAELNALTVGLGLEYGGTWLKQDLPHWEWHPGFTRHDAHMLAAFADAEGFLPTHFFRDRGANA